MATPNEKLAASLEELRQLQLDGSRVFASTQLSRTSRERLLKQGFLQEAMKGWLISASPTVQPGDTTPWFASFWEFCRRYCDDHFGNAWHVSPEQSLLLHAEDTAIPRQVIIYSPAANNNRIDLLFETSLFALKQKAMPPPGDLETRQGVRVFRIDAALIRVPEGFFADHPIAAQVVLGRIRDPSELLARLLDGGHTVVAGRLAGAFRHLGQPAIADEVVAAMKSAGHAVRETDPLDAERAVAPMPRSAPPIVARLHALWVSARDTVLAALPPPPGRPRDRKAYLRRVDEIYQLDAYHSLSIEGYQVTPDLVQRVASGSRDPELQPLDRDSANALAARGYWLAFRRARDTVRAILGSAGGVELLRTAHRDWYREMFSPHVAAGLMTAGSLAGYRTHPVYLRGSRHVPPRSDVLRDAMPALFDLIEGEPSPAVRAVLGHWLFGYVHPFPDGNGRIARLLMNALLAGGGYPWTVIRVEHRDEYLAALEAASVAGDIGPFARFIAKQLRAAAVRPPRPRTPRRRATTRRPRRR
ncbi:MAG TPA: Fic family protein [Kofleriaceae bacterium]